MNICITGALGHIGSALIRNISVLSIDKVYLIDNLSTQRYSSLFDLPKDINYCFYEMDILSDDIEAVIKDSDVLIHLAAVTNAEASFYNREILENVNKKGLKKVAELCSEYDCSLIFPSSTSVYGIQEGLVDEDCKEKDLKPQSPYADSKLYGEELLKSLAGQKGLRFVTFRLGTIFGYSIGMRFHTAVNKFIWQASLNQDITVWKTALNQKRPYCGLNDCINAFNHAVKEGIFDCKIYNIVTANLTVKDILDVIREYIPRINIKFVDSPIMNQLSYNASNAKSLEKDFVYTDLLKEKVEEIVAKLKSLNKV